MCIRDRCRRLILDRLRVYGEKTALIVSALAFAALHGNLSQFFYAFVLGLFFGYLYLRTGKLRYTIFLHMIINVFSTILSALSMDLLSLADFEAAGFASLDPLLLLRIFAAVILMSIEYSFALAGLVLLILRRKSFVFPGGEPRLIPEGERLRTVLVNPGILASIFCTGLVFLLGYLI